MLAQPPPTDVVQCHWLSKSISGNIPTAGPVGLSRALIKPAPTCRPVRARPRMRQRRGIEPLKH
ncbi:MAG: hypothetical protein HYR94_06720 [Chloroflexi bacterium]|nr:hypothetical protein [Chloroflexota bacterium]